MPVLIHSPGLVRRSLGVSKTFPGDLQGQNDVHDTTALFSAIFTWFMFAPMTEQQWVEVLAPKKESRRGSRLYKQSQSLSLFFLPLCELSTKKEEKADFAVDKTKKL